MVRVRGQTVIMFCILGGKTHEMSVGLAGRTKNSFTIIPHMEGGVSSSHYKHLAQKWIEDIHASSTMNPKVKTGKIPNRRIPAKS